MSNIITIGEITEMTAGDKDNPTWINDDFEAVVSNVTEKKTKTNKVYYTATLTDPHSSNISMDAQFWMSGITRFNGKVCRFSGQGIKLEEYKGNVKVVLGDKAKINVVGSAPAAGAGKSTQQQKPTTGQGAKGPAAGKKPVNGATVGMAINQAIGIIKDTQPEAPLADYYLTPAFGKELHTLASDIIRVSAYLEAGNLAEPSNKRNAPPPAPEPEPEPEPEPTEPEAQAPADGEDVPF